MHERSRRYLRIIGVLVAFVALAILPGGSVNAATTVKNPRAEQERVRREKAAAAEQLNVLKATDKELQDALAVIDENLRQEEAALEAAQRTVATEEQAAEALRVQEQAATDKLADLDRILVNSAVDAYMRPPFEGDLFSMSSSDINEALRKQALFDLTSNSNRDAADQVKALRADLERLEAERNAAVARAQQARADVTTRVSVVDSAREEQAKIVAAADARVDQTLGELRSLDSLDKQIAAQIEAEVRALAAQAEKARRASAAANKPFTPPPNSELVTVNGIVVHNSIANGLRNLMAAADAAGIDLGGTGYRDSSGQIALRRQNCGTSDFAVYQMDPFKCRPPTARPGSSNHERGLAIDFTSNGTVLTRGSKAFQWMTQNAGKYGFYNLPSEPWHWSSDGK
jgi:LAS superfamily LD-carboxypeptidase LdcB